MIGATLNQYQITASIGAGGMGEVFRARDTRLHRDVAVKVLPKDFVADADRLRRFEQETKTLAALNHPNILTIHDAGVHEGAPYLVSELLEGRTLREVLGSTATTALPVRKATEYALQIAQGLAAAHGKGIIHRDLKPENIFVTKDGRVKILDFGLAKLCSRQGDESDAPKSPSGPPPHVGGYNAETLLNTTEPGMVLGTPAYMSPEQVRGEPVDHRADIFAFGCVLYEMLSGTRAFRRNTPVESMNAVLHDSQPELSAKHPNVPLPLALIVERCLEKHPDNRFQSAKDLAFALESFSGRSTHRAERQITGSRGARHVVLVAVASGIVFVSIWAFVQYGLRPAGRFTSVQNTPGRISSLAVKPLDDFSGDTNQAYLSDGMTEALCAALGNISALRVPGRSSVMRYKGAQKSILEMAKELNVDAIVEGSIQRATNRLLITVQLIQAATDRHLWSTNYERDMSEFFKVQSEVARAVANEIQVRLTPEDQARLARARAANPDAIEACLLGMHHWWRWSDEGMSNALHYFEKASEIAPDYAPAHAGVALTYSQAAYWWFWRPRDAMPKGKKEAQSAIELDSLLADGYVARGFVALAYDWDWAGAEKDFKRATELSPKSSLALDGLANFFVSRGRFPEAIITFKKAAQLDPLSSALQTDFGWAYQWMGRFDLAAEHLGKALELDRNFFQAHYFLGWNYQLTGKTAEALAEFQATHELDPDSPAGHIGLGYALGCSGRRAEALKALTELERLAKVHYVTPAAQAYVYVGLGEKDTAIDWFEKAYQERDNEMAFLQVDPVLTALRNEPRFQALAKKVEGGGKEK